jgi:hypothetical protein
MTLVTATRNVSKASDARNDTKMLMQPYANWEEFLMPAPISIAILGELVFISSGTDFSINKNAPKDGYKLIRYPDSFRASLMQVTNSGWAAFNEAHKNMDQVRLHSYNVGGYVKMAVTILMQNDDKIINAMLPDQLENIVTIAETCTTLSTSVERKFEYVIELIAELMEACVNAKAAYGEESAEMEKKIKESKLRQQAAEKHKEFTEKSLQQMTKRLESANEQYQKAMDSMPSGWTIVGMNFVEGLFSSTTNILSETTKSMANPSLKSGSIQNEAENSIANRIAYSKAGILVKLIETMNGFVDEGEIKWDKLYSDKRQEQLVPEWILQQLKDIEGSLDSSDKCTVTSDCRSICKEASEICRDLASISKADRSNTKETKRLIDNLTNLYKQAKKFDVQSKAAMGAPSFPVMPPQLANNQQNSPAPKKASAMAVENARFRIEESRAQLNQVQQMMEKTTDEMQKTHRELTEILITMQNCNLKQIEFKDSIKMLVQGLDAMGKVKDQWAKMVRFFQMISNIIKTTLGTSLKNFASTAQKASDSALEYTAKSFMKDMIYQQAFYASNVASLVCMISGTYTQVSNRYIMDRISSLGKLMGMDPKMPEFETERRKLQEGCREAEEGIKLLVLKNRKDFDRNATERLAKIERELEAALPPATEDEINRIKETVDQGMKAISTEDQEQYA